ncbi:MAG: trypsin-like peptidase domain-containing protein [Oscillatoria sp. SIO1A7]|nr:trypsin-like peptidase domain-containing protein [Oscillatoria sp. SIO1A7]
MKIYSRLAAILLCATVLLARRQVLVAQTIPEIKNRAEKSAVLIIREKVTGEGTKFAGSGVIIGWEEGEGGEDYNYYVLTAGHVVPTEINYQVTTHDGIRHNVDYSTVEQISGGDCVDLAVLQFNSDRRYKPVKLDESDWLGKDAEIYLFGWAEGANARFVTGEMVDPELETFEPGSGCKSLAFQFPEDQIEGGMSGGPVLNRSGDLVGIFVAIRVFGPQRGTWVKTFRSRAKANVLNNLKEEPPTPLSPEPSPEPTKPPVPPEVGENTDWWDVLGRVLTILAFVGGVVFIAIKARPLWENKK